MPKPNIMLRMLADNPQAVLLSGSGRLMKAPGGKGVVQFDADGLPCRIVWSRAGGEVVISHNFDFLRRAPGLAIDVATAVAATYTTDNSAETIESAAKYLRGGLFAYFRQDGLRDLAPAEIKDEHVRDLIDLLRRQGVEDGVRESRYDHACRFLKMLPNVTAELPANPFRGRNFSRPTILDTPVIYQVLQSAAHDVLMHKQRLDARTDPTNELWNDPHSAAVLTLMAEIRRRFPRGPANDDTRRLPTDEEIQEFAPDLANAFASIPRETLADWWGPTAGNLGSSLVLTLYFFRLNLALARDLRWGENGTIGDETIVNKQKKRAGDLRRLPGYLNGSEPMNAGILRSFLRTWTEDLRACAGVERSRVFLYWTAGIFRTRQPIAHFGPNNAPRRALNAFISTYKLPHFTASMIRPTTVELVDMSTQGAPEMATAAGRHTSDVRRRRYTSSNAVLRSLLRLGSAMPIRARAMRAHHAALATGRVGGDHVAATPGWNCSSPYYRGFSSAPEGELCDAIGRCPVCRFGRPDLDCVRSYANTLALLEAVGAENVRGREVEWIGVFRPIQTAIVQRWLPSFEQHVRDTPDHDLPQVPSMKGALRWPTF